MKSRFYIKEFSKISLLWAVVFLSACTGFEFSPYDTFIPQGLRDSNAKNIQKIKESGLAEDYRFAVISDVHTSYDELDACIKHINGTGNIAFVVITGDLTHLGHKDEYLQLYNLLAGLNMPVLAVIGNHDFFTDGDAVFRQLFGELNYSFVVQRTRYVFFDSNFGAEGDNVQPVWLKDEVSDTTDAGRVLLFAHVAPWSFINPEDSVLRKQYLEVINMPRLACSFWGHEHYSALYETPFMCYTDCLAHRNYALVSVTAQSINITRVEF